MNDWWLSLLGVLLGLFLGLGAGMVLAIRRSREQLHQQMSRAVAAEALLAESRQAEARAQTECRDLRERMHRAEGARLVAETRLAEFEKHLHEQQRVLDEAKAKLSETFKTLAAEALAGNTAGFLALAEEKFKSLKEGATQAFESRQQALEALVKPLMECMATYQKETRAFEDRRLREFSAVGEQLRMVAAAQSTLQAETAKLVNALRSPQVRGRWGEMTLRRTAELAGMSRYCDFDEQPSVIAETGALRPDMIVRLPAGREIVVDSKVPLVAYLEALELTTEEEREQALARHANLVKQHIHALSSKEYWDQFSGSPEFVVLFIPNDSFLAAAAERDPSLVEMALGKKIVIATPTTFIALLRAIAYGWRQEQVAENAQRISALGQELSERLSILADHLIQVGSALGKTVESYNKAVASLESRVLPSARKFKALGVGGKRAVEELHPIDQQPRTMASTFHDDADAR